MASAMISLPLHDAPHFYQAFLHQLLLQVHYFRTVLPDHINIAMAVGKNGRPRNPFKMPVHHKAFVDEMRDGLAFPDLFYLRTRIFLIFQVNKSQKRPGNKFLFPKTKQVRERGVDVTKQIILPHNAKKAFRQIEESP
jgi:hypothetical protein